MERREWDIEFFACGNPKPQPRPRAFAQRVGNQIRVRAYDPSTAEGWKSQVAEAARNHVPLRPLECPLALELCFLMPRPQSHYGKLGLKESAPHYHASKPDASTLTKAVVDALLTLGMWGDDSQICRLIVSKIYTDTDPGCHIHLYSLEHEVVPKPATNKQLYLL